MQEERKPDETEDVEAHVRAGKRNEDLEDDPGVRSLAEDDDDVEAHMRIGKSPSTGPEQRNN